MTNQEMFDKAVAGLAAQGFRRSVLNEGELEECCQYRGPDGMKCALGHVISDEQYNRSIEGSRAHDAIRALKLPLKENAANELQDCHDEAKGPDDMKRRLRKFADNWNLVVPEVLR